METIEYIIKSVNENLDFLRTDFGFRAERKYVAYENSYILKNNKVELQFLTCLGSISLPDITFMIYGINFDLNKLSNQNKLEKIYKKNYTRTNPISEKFMNKYVREKEYDDSEVRFYLEKNKKSDIEELLIEIAEIFKNNENILKGNIYPFIRARFNRIKKYTSNNG